MIRNWIAEHDLLIVADAERAVVLSQTFVEPRWSIAGRIVHEQMSIFMENDVERILLSTHLCSERDVVHIRTRLKLFQPGLDLA